MKTRKTSVLFFSSLLLYNIESKLEFKNCLKHKLFPYKIVILEIMFITLKRKKEKERKDFSIVYSS